MLARETAERELKIAVKEVRVSEAVEKSNLKLTKNSQFVSPFFL